MEWFRCGSVLSGLIEHVGDIVIPRSFFEKLGNETRLKSSRTNGENSAAPFSPGVGNV